MLIYACKILEKSTKDAVFGHFFYATGPKRASLSLPLKSVFLRHLSLFLLFNCPRYLICNFISE
jgi:hypothetical protein